MTSRIKFLIFLVSIFLFVAAMAIVSYYFWSEISSGIDKLAGKSAEQAPNEEWMVCAVDADCMETQADCCDCGHGGIQLGINKQYIEQWQAVLKKKCQDISCIAMFNCKDGKAVCENSKCVFKEDVETVSESPTEKNINLDSDNDELTDVDETKYGTDSNNPDSDGDGYLDGDEVKNGYNPIGEGKLELNTSTLDLLPAQKLVIQNAAVALEKEDIDSFVSYVPAYEQDSMRYQFKEFSQTALYGLANTLRNAIVINQTEKNVELETVMDLPGGIKQPVTFEMILEGESWKITGL